MNLVMNSEQEVVQEGVLVLLDHLGASKTARFLSAWRQGAGNYVTLRDTLFVGETVTSLYEKITAFETATQNT
jgi:hypothetical protein